MSARDATFAVYAVIGVALVALQAVTWRRGSLTLGQLTSHLMRRRSVRLVFLLGWAWLGWHLFARGSATFLH
jgi:Family of unknown function (DUF6186)